MQYMIDAEYTKLAQPDFSCGESPTFHINPPTGKGQLSDASTPHILQNTRPHSNDAIDELRKQFSREISELQSKNQMLISEIDDVKSQMSCIKSDQHKKMNLIVSLQGEIHTYLLDIKSTMQLMSDSITAMIFSSMDEVLNKVSEKFVAKLVYKFEPIDNVKHIEKTGELKGEGKLDTADELGFPCTLELQFFDLGVRSI
ncbi:Hypothetical predicted protein [Olea europaea subsp. europaea]|uniref:Uncharacterized protein n=1 Tax=Olea europaea subsp. europaea TaxID=158383 RepID=A0A8S0UFZ5_OLEEU|nr:Hypothetical predicted protein [Olea europaea subsp. europaea]